MDSTTSPTDQPDHSSREPVVLGRTLGSGLRVLEQIGETSAGPLYRAEYAMTGVEVTLALLRAGRECEAPPDESARLARLLQQLRRASEIDHPNVAAVLGVDETPEGLVYAIVEFLQGELLAEILAARQALSLREAVQLILQAAAGLQAVHEAGIVHGDVSPATMLITRTVEGQPLVKLIGFALSASSGDEESEPAIDKTLNTDYASPERLAGHPPDVRGDVFSLGAVLHHLLTGAPPGAGTTPAKPIPRLARPVLAKALAASPADRFQTVADFAAALRGLVIRRSRISRLIPPVMAASAAVAVALAALWLWWGPLQRGGSAVPGEVAVARGSADSTPRPESAMGRSGQAQRVVAATEQPIEGTWRLLAHRVGEEVLRPPRADGFFRVRDGVILLQLHRTVGDTLFEFYGSGGYSGSPERFSYGYDRMVWVTRRPTGVTALDTLPFEGRRVFQVRSVGARVRYEADGGRYVLEVVGDTLYYSEAGAWVRRWIRVPPLSSP